MLKKAEASIAFQYGITGGVVSFVYILLLALLGLENPYNNVAEFSSTLIFVPVFVVLGIRGYKRYANPEMGLGKALLVGWAVTVTLALTAALLLGIYSSTFGADMIQAYISEMQRQMEVNQTTTGQKIEAAQYKILYQELGNLNAFHLAQRSFVYRFLTGLLVSLVSGVYFRK